MFWKKRKKKVFLTIQIIFFSRQYWGQMVSGIGSLQSKHSDAACRNSGINFENIFQLPAS